MHSSSTIRSTLATQEVSDIVFSDHRAIHETRLLRSKVGQMIGTALQAMAEASCKTLRRRVGQRLRRKLGRILMQEEFEQALAIYKRYEDDLLNETEEHNQQAEVDDAASEGSILAASTSPHSTTSPSTRPSATSLCVGVAVPVIAVPVLVPVMAAASGHGHGASSPSGAVAPRVTAVSPLAVTSPVSCEPVEPASPTTSEVTIPPIAHFDVQKESRFTRLCTETTTCTGSSVMDDDDFLDQHIDWIRGVSDGAPVERTFIQFNTNLKVSRRSRSR